MSARPDVVVVGGGAIGLASAWRLAQRGAAVVVVDPSPGAGASGVAAGMLAPVTEARLGEEQLLALGLASWDLWPAFAAELGPGQIGYRSDGTILVALDGDDRAALRDVVDRRRAMGLAVDDLGARELRALEPALAPGVRAGARADDERSVDPAALVGVLERVAVESGVELRRESVTALVVEDGTALGPNGAARRDVTAGGIDAGGDGPSATVGPGGAGGREGGDGPRFAPSGPATVGRGDVGSPMAVPGAPGRVVGVQLEGGERILADTVVLAAGSWSGGLFAVPVRPVKGQIVTLRQRPGDVVVHHMVRGIVRGSGVYLVPRDDGRVVCGASVEEKGWDDVPTAGAAYELLRDVLALFPGLDDAELVGMRAGFRPGTPDDLPLVGPSGIEGLVVATGHYRNGILLTPITAAAVAAAVLGEPLPDELAACDPRRFTEPVPRRPAPPISSPEQADGTLGVRS